MPAEFPASIFAYSRVAKHVSIADVWSQRYETRNIHSGPGLIGEQAQKLIPTRRVAHQQRSRRPTFGDDLAQEEAKHA